MSAAVLALRVAGIVERLSAPDAQGRQIRLVREVPTDFAHLRAAVTVRAGGPGVVGSRG